MCHLKAVWFGAEYGVLFSILVCLVCGAAISMSASWAYFSKVTKSCIKGSPAFARNSPSVMTAAKLSDRVAKSPNKARHSLDATKKLYS
jgi:hypothetical protein